MTGVLIVSTAITLLAVVWSVILLRRQRNWRMGLLTAMLVLMTLRQLFSLRSLLESGALAAGGRLLSARRRSAAAERGNNQPACRRPPAAG